MEISIDTDVDAAYIRLSSNPVDRTRELAPNVFVDFDSDDEVVGIEILDINDQLDDSVADA